jgi:hypothetical protein
MNKMNRNLVMAGCFFILTAFTCALFAQDVIVTKDSKRINAKVTEVNPDDIKYKNFDNPDGPTYTEVAKISKPLAMQQCMDCPELRAADETPRHDSLIRYNPAGEKQWKRIEIPDGADTYRTECYKWNGNAWVSNAVEGCARYGPVGQIPVAYSVKGNDVELTYPTSSESRYTLSHGWTIAATSQVTPVYSAQRLTKLTIGSSNVIDITYNSAGYPVSIIGNYNGAPYFRANYKYHSDNVLCTFFEETYLSNGVWLSRHRFEALLNNKGQVISASAIDMFGIAYHFKWVYDYKESLLTRRYDYSDNGKSWNLDEVTLYYYPGIPPAYTGISGNQPVGDDNKGGYDVAIDIPKDSIAGGSFVVRLPAGFTLDRSATKPSADFSDFDLAVTPQANNAWLLAFTPKASRNSLPAKTLANIAYTVDGAVKPGIYDISVGNIAFKTRGGYDIIEPVLTVPAPVNRWGVGNEQMEAPTPAVYAANQTIHIQAANAEYITIYSIPGLKLYETEIQPGLNTINASRFPQGILFIKGSRGWTKKLVIKQ